MVFGYFRKEITCEILVIFVFVHVNQNSSDEGLFHFCGSGYICYFYVNEEWFQRSEEVKLADATKHKSRVHRLYFIGVLLQGNFKNRLFVKLGS